MPKRKKFKSDPFDTPEYRKLVEDIRKVIDDAAAKGVDLRRRDDLLSCRYCKAYEDVTVKDERIICAGTNEVLGQGEFIMIDHKQRSTHRNKISYYKTTYEFICSICGAQQKAVIHDRFEN